MMRRVLLLVIVLVVAGLAVLWWRRGAEAVPRQAQKGQSTPTTAQPPATAGARGAATLASADPGQGGVDSAPSLAVNLNAPDSTISQDLETLQHLFDNWRSNFPREGNPVGENAEITAALMGENRLKLVLIPKGHRAISARGELCDRWGTPFRFHQLSGNRMEVRSAGPDRKFATDDDAVWTPR